jgi:hypothetical protein
LPRKGLVVDPTTAMIDIIISKIQNLIAKLSKLITIANPAFGLDFLEKISVYAQRQFISI